MTEISQILKQHTARSTSQQPVLGPLWKISRQTKGLSLVLFSCLGTDVSRRRLKGIFYSLMKDFITFLPLNFANISMCVFEGVTSPKINLFLN